MSSVGASSEPGVVGAKRCVVRRLRESPAIDVVIQNERSMEVAGFTNFKIAKSVFR